MTNPKTTTPRKAGWERTDNPAEMSPAQIIKDRREQIGMSQGELARRLDYSNANFISMIEMGWSFAPLEKVPEIAEILRLPTHWLIERVMAGGMARGSRLHAFYYGHNGELRRVFELDLARAALAVKAPPRLVVA